MANFKVITFLLLLSLTTACGADYGHELHVGELTVFFTNDKDKESARQVGLFWKENNFLTGKKQHVQLTRRGKVLELRLIMNDEKSTTPISFEEKKLLFQLQDTLSIIVKGPVEVHLCNARFETLVNPNK